MWVVYSRSGCTPTLGLVFFIGSDVSRHLEDDECLCGLLLPLLVLPSRADLSEDEVRSEILAIEIAMGDFGMY